MELGKIGEHCSEKSCKQNDFLPITCNYCHEIFCKEHIVHDCSKKIDRIVENVKENNFESFICNGQLCKTTSPIEMNCVKCKKHFCLTHRYHGCLEKTEEEIKKQTQLWNAPVEEFSTAKTAVDEEISKNLQKSKNTLMANKIKLMKLKGCAVGGAKDIPTVDRRYFLVYPPISSKKSSKAVYVCVNWTIGKIIDTIADIFQVKNNNNLKESLKLRLFSTNNGSCYANKMDTLLSDLFHSNELIDGESLILEYSNTDTIDFSLYK